MLYIVAQNVLKPGAKAAFLETARELIEKTRQEQGNLSYSLFEDIHDPNVVTFIERWRDEAAIAAHNNSEHFQRIVPLLAQFQAKEGMVNTYREL